MKKYPENNEIKITKDFQAYFYELQFIYSVIIKVHTSIQLHLYLYIETIFLMIWASFTCMSYNIQQNDQQHILNLLHQNT